MWCLPPPKIIDQIRSMKKTYKQLTAETVVGFFNDAKKSGFKI